MIKMFAQKRYWMIVAIITLQFFATVGMGMILTPSLFYMGQNVQPVEQHVPTEIPNAIEEKPNPQPQEEVVTWDELTFLLGEAKTQFNTDDMERSANIELAAKKIDEVILKSGELFSFIDTAGPFREDEGYQLAPVIQDLSFEEGPGGGVCQVSSTLYLASLYSQLDIIERHHHQRPVSYMPKGLDATVSPDGLDLKIKNPFRFPIGIRTTITDGEILVQIFGNQEIKQQDVFILAEEVEKIPYEGIFQEDETIPLGSPKIKREGDWGYKVKVSRMISADGEEMEEVLISEDTYLPIPEIILHHPDEDLNVLKKKYKSSPQLG